MDAFALTYWTLLVAVVARSYWVFRIEMRRLDEMLARLADDPDFAEVLAVAAMLKQFEQQGFFARMFDLRLWTYAQFFPQELSHA